MTQIINFSRDAGFPGCEEVGREERSLVESFKRGFLNLCWRSTTKRKLKRKEAHVRQESKRKMLRPGSQEADLRLFTR